MEIPEILEALAEVGSIDGLLARVDGVTREVVEASLRQAAATVAAASPPRDSLSPLYRAYNGLMLGLFVGSAYFFDFREERERHEKAIRRVTEFLIELGSQCGAPLELADAEQSSLEDAVEKAVRTLDEELADYYLLGLVTFRCAIFPGRDDDDGREDVDEACRLLQNLGHPPVVFRQAVERHAESAGNEVTWQDMMSWGLEVARRVVSGLQPEADTCFVALPFEKVFEERYLTFYRAAADRMEKRAVRAWGDLGREEHQELLLALISLSGALLADVTRPNSNVALEIGFALGQQKDVYLVAEEEEWKGVANIQLDWVYPYRMSADEWELEQADRAGLYFTALKSLRRPGIIPSWSFKPLDILGHIAEAVGGDPPPS